MTMKEFQELSPSPHYHTIPSIQYTNVWYMQLDANIGSCAFCSGTFEIPLSLHKKSKWMPSPQSRECRHMFGSNITHLQTQLKLQIPSHSSRILKKELLCEQMPWYVCLVCWGWNQEHCRSCRCNGRIQKQVQNGSNDVKCFYVRCNLGRVSKRRHTLHGVSMFPQIGSSWHALQCTSQQTEMMLEQVWSSPQSWCQSHNQRYFWRKLPKCHLDANWLKVWSELVWLGVEVCYPIGLQRGTTR